MKQIIEEGKGYYLTNGILNTTKREHKARIKS